MSLTEQEFYEKYHRQATPGVMTVEEENYNAKIMRLYRSNPEKAVSSVEALNPVSTVNVVEGVKVSDGGSINIDGKTYSGSSYEDYQKQIDNDSSLSFGEKISKTAKLKVSFGVGDVQDIAQVKAYETKRINATFNQGVVSPKSKPADIGIVSGSSIGGVKTIVLTPEDTKTVYKSVGKESKSVVGLSLPDLSTSKNVETIRFGPMVVKKESVSPSEAMNRTSMSLRDDTGNIILTTREDLGTKPTESYDPMASERINWSKSGGSASDISPRRKALENSILGLQKRERNMQETDNLINSKIDNLVGVKASKFIGIPGTPFKGEFAKGLLKKVIRTPYDLTIGFGQSLASTIDKSFVFTGALLTPESKSNAKSELLSGFGKTGKVLVQEFNPTTPEGLVNIGLVGLGTYTLGKSKAVSRASKSIQETSLQPMKGEQFYGEKTTSFDLKGDVKFRNLEYGEMTNPEGFLTSRYKVVNPEPTVAVAKQIGIGDKGTVTRINIGGKEYTTVTKGDYTGISVMDKATGKGRIKILQEKSGFDLQKVSEKAIKTKPETVTLEAYKTEVTERIKMPELTSEYKKGVGFSEFKSGVISEKKPYSILKTYEDIRVGKQQSIDPISEGSVSKAKMDIRGRIKTTTEQKLAVTTKKPGLDIKTYGYEINLDTFKIRPKDAQVDVAKTTYEFVDYTPKQKPLDITMGDIRTRIIQPTQSVTFQKQTAKTVFNYEFVKPKSKFSQLVESKKGQLGTSVVQETRLVQVKRPSTKTYFGELSVFTPSFNSLSSRFFLVSPVTTTSYSYTGSFSKTSPSRDVFTQQRSFIYGDANPLNKTTSSFPMTKSYSFSSAQRVYPENERISGIQFVSKTVNNSLYDSSLKSSSRMINESKSSLRERYGLINKGKEALVQEPVSKTINESVSESKSLTENVIVTKTKTRQKTLQEQLVIARDLNIEASPRINSRPSPAPNPKPKIFNPPFIIPPFFLRSYSMNGDFLISVRRGGKWKAFARKDSLTEAFRVGKGYTWNTAGASFKVTATTIKGKDELSRAGISRQYYKSGREEDVFIEKAQYRIKSYGEKREISLAGVESQKRSRRGWF